MTNWTDKKFGDLKPEELYAILRLRSEVFVVEQNCIFLDMDNKDQVSHHLMGWQENKLVACARIVPAGISYVETSIGRIVSSPDVRGQGIGRVLVDRSIKLAYALHGKGVIHIGAQNYLRGFYESFGFEKAGEIYLEDGIEHIEMLLLTKE
ncbi:GNAT family N-acetyltransferase [Flavitalea sp. BT771]|uniref:GNAT family N-acetyltransferase n=1 Tax=Flavitalea sp. BT771 TaxID=3063329 RepID=UPI0026E3E817|nr:GNAT family N-acetyltransferase [Flavitalea sp. BT771]MDO6429150.1 GNAT family N-acetyltransferase [Flavitalea sp. BT771]MDV6218722.1 GNAT family N-acetyltransferase [Flavitalea sp. BT771]